MQEAIETAIKHAAAKAATATSPDEALKFTQAALNAAHALSILSNIDK